MRLDAEKFIKLLEEEDISHEEASEMAGLSRRVFDWILRKGFISKETLKIFADIVGSSVADIMEPDPGDEGENVLEFRRNQKVATLTLCQGRYITRVKELAKRYPDECNILAVNKDGSILAEIPTEWIRINPSVELSEERKEKLAEHARKYLLNRN